jgi:hypothetical protein
MCIPTYLARGLATLTMQMYANYLITAITEVRTALPHMLHNVAFLKDQLFNYENFTSISDAFISCRDSFCSFNYFSASELFHFEMRIYMF